MLQNSGPQAMPGQMHSPGTYQWAGAVSDVAEQGMAPWRVSGFHYPFYGDAREKLAFCLRYAILAPSSHNTQPWRFALRGNEVELYADHTRSLPTIDPDNRELIISCGAALANLSIALKHFEHEGKLALFPEEVDQGGLAIVGLGRQYQPTCQDEILFQTIAMRRTNRSAYENTPISRSLLCGLRAACASQNVSFTETSDVEQKLAIASLVGEGDRRQMANPEFRAELANWIRPAKSESHDGIPCYVQNLPKVLDFATPIIARLIRTFDMGDFTAPRDADLANASGALAVISTPTDTRKDWLTAGMALEHVLLTARAAGVWTSFLNQPIEIPELRAALRELTGCPGTPQILLRMGYGRESEPTPRRPLDEVLCD